MQLPAFLLPAILATFSLAFGIVWRRGSRPAFWWMLAYGAQGLAYLGEIVPTVFHESIDTMLVDAVFVLGFFGFGQAVCLHFGWPRRVALNACLAIAVCATDSWQIFVVGSLKGELLAVDWGLAALALSPFLADLRRLTDTTTDRAMVAAMSVTVLNCVTVSSMFALFGDAHAGFDTYMASGYVSVSYAVTALLNVVVPLIQLTAVALRVIADHRSASEVDMLTGLLNRRGFERACLDRKRPRDGCVVACDIDRFKTINDGFGHAVGDRVLVELAGTIRAALPSFGFAARFGGEEFVIVLPAASADDAAIYAAAVASGFTATVAERLPVDHPVTSSFGIATFGAVGAAMHDDLRRADRALYAAKQAGRNRVSVDPACDGRGTAKRDCDETPALRAVA